MLCGYTIIHPYNSNEPSSLNISELIIAQLPSFRSLHPIPSSQRCRKEKAPSSPCCRCPRWRCCCGVVGRRQRVAWRSINGPGSSKAGPGMEDGEMGMVILEGSEIYGWIFLGDTLGFGLGEVHGVLFFLNWDGSLEVGVSGSVVGSS